MKILHIFSHMDIGGAQTMFVDIMNAQIREHEVTLIVFTDVYNVSLLEKLQPAIKIIKLNRHVGGKNYFPYLRLNYILNFGGYDAIHLHEISMWKYIYVLPWLRRYHTVHNTGLHVLGYALNKCDKIFCISKTVFKDVVKYLHSDRNVLVAMNGIHPNTIKQKTNLSIPLEYFRIVCVSRLVIRHKGQDLIVEAVNKLRVQGRLPENIRIDFIGEGESWQTLHDLISEYQLQDIIQLCGARNREYVYEHLADYDLFIQPSRFEGFGLTVVEAMAAKLPVLVSRNEGPYEIIDNDHYGYSFEKENIDDLANKMLYIIDNYQEALKKAEEGCAVVAKLYNVENTAKIYIDNYIK